MNDPLFSPTRRLITVLVLLFLIEAVVMAVIDYLELPRLVEAILDSFALIILAMPVLYLQFIRPMIQHYQAAVEARRTAETLRNTSLELSRTLDLNRVADILLNQVRELVSFDYAALYLLQSPSWLVTKATRGSGPGTVSGGQETGGFDPQSSPLIDRVLKEQESLLVPDIQAVRDWIQPAEMASARSWMGIPLVAGGRKIGLCSFGHAQPDTFTQEKVRLAEGVVSQAAVAIQNAWLFEQVQTGRERLKTLTRKIVEVQETEKQSVARDLYDEVGQAVVSVLYQVRLLEQKIDQPEVLRNQISELDRDLSAVLENLNTLAVNLRPASLDHLGLSAAIQQDLEEISQKNGLVVQFENYGGSARLPDAVETVLYRIVQEALTNITKHSHASQVGICFERLDRQIKMIVEDDGVGFNAETIDQDGCLGIMGMRERAEMIGGELSIESAPGKGTTIIVTAPDPEER